MPEITQGVTFEWIAREWRCKWSRDNDKASLQACQEILNEFTTDINKLPGLLIAKRVVCGSCHDFKVILLFGAPEEPSEVAPEEAVLAKLKAVEGVSAVETQTYAMEQVFGCMRSDEDMIEITPGVQFNKIAREWRCKWSPEGDNASLQKCQAVLDEHIAEIKQLPGLIGIERFVCGNCHDFKVVIQLTAGNFGSWESSSKFAPEEAVISKLGAIEGVTGVETQTYTLMPVIAGYM